MREVKSMANESGRTRLFVARGRSHGFDAKKLIKYIQDETDIAAKEILDVKVLEDFSFITCPFEQAEYIIRIFKRKNAGRSIVSIAKERK